MNGRARINRAEGNKERMDKVSTLMSATSVGHGEQSGTTTKTLDGIGTYLADIAFTH